MSCIYGLYRNNELRYIGKTQGLAHKRLNKHCHDARRGSRLAVHCWIRKHGTPDLVILERDPPAINEAERAWIALARSHDCRLLNLSDGGGSGTAGVKESEETRRKKREAMLRLGQNELQREGLRKARLAAAAPEARTKAGRAISAATRGKSGRPHTPESRAKIADANRRRIWTPEMRQAAGARLHGPRLTDEHRAKIAAGLRAAYAEGRR